MNDTHSLLSPRLAKLKQALDSGDERALVDFWEQVQREGTPLFEQPETDPDKTIVTLLWREREPVENVGIIGEVMDHDPSGQAMERLEGTDVLYKSYLWLSNLLTCYELSPNDPLTPIVFGENWEERTRTWQTDPLNPQLFRVNVKDEEDPKSKEKYLSVLRLRGAPPQPWVEPRTEGLAGLLDFRRVESKTMGDERRIWIYTPPGYSASSEACALAVFTDAIPYTRIMDAPITLDNLILGGRIPPTIGVFVDNPDREVDLGLNPRFASYLAEELVPQLRAEFHITDDRARMIIGGTSLGGLNAVFVAMLYSDVFGAVLSQSGAFQYPTPDCDEEEWLAWKFANSRTGPLRVYLDVGLHEIPTWQATAPSILMANRHMRDVLIAAGHTVFYHEFNGAHNYICWRGTLADGLLDLLGGG